MPTEYDVGIVTVKGTKVCHVEWKIENYFLRRQKMDIVWRSPIFGMWNVLWHLSLYPKGPAWPDTVRWVGLFLEYESKPDTHPVAFMMGIKRGDGSIHSYFEGPGNCRWHFGSHQLLEYSELLKGKDIIAPEGDVTFFVTIFLPDLDSSRVEVTAPEMSENDGDKTSEEEEARTFIWKTENGDNSIDVSLDLQGLNNFCNDFKNLLLSGEDSDVNIRVKNRKFEVHRAILSARSQVFASMFRHDMMERKLGFVDIVDCDPDAFAVFLMFLYSGRPEGISFDNVIDLYAVGAKYDVEDLRTLCVRYMQREMSVDSFCDVMVLAVSYNVEDLIKFSTEFFVSNADSILPTVRWQRFLEENPIQANELYMKALQRRVLPVMVEKPAEILDDGVVVHPTNNVHAVCYVPVCENLRYAPGTSNSYSRYFDG